MGCRAESPYIYLARHLLTELILTEQHLNAESLTLNQDLAGTYTGKSSGFSELTLLLQLLLLLFCMSGNQNMILI